MHFTCNSSVQGNHDQGPLGRRPSTYGGVTKGPNTSKYIHPPELKLRGQYHTCRGIITAYIHVRKGEFQYNNVLHPGTVIMDWGSCLHAPLGGVKVTSTVSTIGIWEQD
jgi:hypothetical protein